LIEYKLSMNKSIYLCDHASIHQPMNGGRKVWCPSIVGWWHINIFINY
jgi:hypothetical protein